MSKKRTTIAKSSKTSSAASSRGTAKQKRRVTVINRPVASFIQTDTFRRKLEELTYESFSRSLNRENTRYQSAALRTASAYIGQGDWEAALLAVPQIASDAVWTRAIVEILNQSNNGVSALQHHKGKWDISVAAESGLGRRAWHEVKVASLGQNNRFQANFSPGQVAKGKNLLFVMQPQMDKLDAVKVLHIGFSDLLDIRENKVPGASLSMPNGSSSGMLSISLATAEDTAMVARSSIAARLLNIGEFAAYAANGLR